MKLFLFTVIVFLSISSKAQSGVPLQSQWVIAYFYKNDTAYYPKEKNAYVALEDTTFSGKAGCREINGKMLASKNAIKIYSIYSDKIFCINSKDATLFISHLLKANQYTINGGELILYYNKQKLMVLESWRD
jgi:heat shock protein HslJ